MRDFLSAAVTTLVIIAINDGVSAWVCDNYGRTNFLFQGNYTCKSVSEKE